MNMTQMVPRIAIAKTFVFILLTAVFVVPEHAQAASEPGWVFTGSLNTPRMYHTATLLQSGKVLVVGGIGNDGSVLDSAELYDPVAGKWSYTGHLNQSRSGHTATLLSDGRVLVAGGRNAIDAAGTAEVYDPVSGSWRLTGSMSASRSGHTATLLKNGKVLVAGGYDSGFLDSAELYDPVTGTWSATGDPVHPRWGPTATLLQDGRVLVVGGTDDGDLVSTLDTSEVYDPAAGAWSATADLRMAVISHTATLLQNGEVLVTGGYLPRFLPGLHGALVAAPIALNGTQIYDPAAGTWVSAAGLTTARASHTATLLPNGRVLVAGGETWQGAYPNLQFGTLVSGELYDPISGTWTATQDLNAARSGHSATLLADGRVLVAGGQSGGTGDSTVLASAELYGAATSAPVSVIEFYNSTQDHYFMTWRPDEIAILDAGVQFREWQRTGKAFLAYPTAQPGTSDICRFYIPPTDGDSHFYGRGPAECAATAAAHPDFVLEDSRFMAMFLPTAGVCPANTTEVYRVFDNRPDANHRYMTDKSLRDQMVSKGWVAEGDGPDLVVMCAPQ
jgi:hypothetical protein